MGRTPHGCLTQVTVAPVSPSKTGEEVSVIYENIEYAPNKTSDPNITTSRLSIGDERIICNGVWQED